jgi:O-antigen/teichoic acid export membrane protein
VFDFRDPVGLRARIQRAGLWISVGHLAESFIRLATSLLLTRLLVPQDFGMMAVAIAIPVGLDLLSDVGIRGNVIRKSSKLGDEFLRTAWTVQALRGMLLWVASLLLAGLLYVPQIQHVIPAKSLLSNPQLPLLLSTVCFSLVIAGFESVNIFVQERDIYFGPLVMRSIISRIITIPVMLAWAYFFPSVWSLVAGALLAQLVMVVSSHIMIPGPAMKFSWNEHHAKDLLRDGRWVTLSSAGTFLVTQGDRLILATMLTASQMGVYAIAWTLADVTRSLLQRLHGQITLPVLSELFRTRPAGAIDAYYKYRKPIDGLAFCATGILWIAAPEILHFLYDNRYADAGWILQVLGLSLASFPYLMTNMCFMANDEWRNFSVNSIILVAAFFSAIVVGYFLFGWMGVIWGIALHSWPAICILLIRAYRRGWVRPIHEILMLPFLLLGIAIGYVIKWILQWIGTVL